MLILRLRWNLLGVVCRDDDDDGENDKGDGNYFYAV